MGISFSYPFTESSDVDTALESVVVKSISFGGDEVKTPVLSVSFSNGDMEPKILKSLGSGKMIVERSVSFKATELQKMISIKASLLNEEIRSLNSDGSAETIQELPSPSPSSPKHEAAVKLQKVYKSFRTRRKLADCAVLVEKSWWKLLDFAELKQSSISFFDIEKHESAISRWSRARTRAAKVGKGLSKNDKAQKLALQHWLEAIDPRHRYGHNLRFYYVKWLHSKSREPFFYWLDIGEGKEVNLVDKCPRSKLQQQCIKYLGPIERRDYEVVLEDGKFIYKQTGDLLHTTNDAKWIFVLSTSKNLYVGKKKKGSFQHSSFLAGGVTTAAGRLIVETGILKAVWPHSGHYQPTEENFQDFLSFLRENNVDLTYVKTSPEDEEEGLVGNQRGSKHHRNDSSEEELFPELNELETEEVNAEDYTPESSDLVEDDAGVVGQQKSSLVHNLGREPTDLEMPNRVEVFVEIETERTAAVSADHLDEEFGAEKDGMVPKRNLISQEQEDNGVESMIPEEQILQRINSKKGNKSLQLGKQLSCKWTTGAGPRIGYLRDYPSELQFQALEQVNLSPRSIICHSTSSNLLNRKMSTPTGFRGEVARTASLPVLEKSDSLQESLLHSRTQTLPRSEGHQ